MDLSKRVLPVTTSFSWKFCFSLRTSYQELIWCTNKQKVHIHTFCKHWSFIWRCFAAVSVLKTWKQKKEIRSKPRWKSESGCDFYFLLLQKLMLSSNCEHLLHCLKSVQIRSFFRSVFTRIRIEYGKILRISPYSVRMRENTDQKKLGIWTLFTQC